LVGADRFLAAIRTTANLQHPHILPLFDSGEADDRTGERFLSSCARPMLPSTPISIGSRSC
jgi:hypothetical protein